ncbi:hypothetical protein M513_07967 [Trichuris suis]|uniref:Uncharacterized protein n=1 Tax=Trichuris suis TaxID=68888 RepID=A0A085M1V7_9BILA|nr:hypothetical protein M513_07967 [Trichuris suis]
MLHSFSNGNVVEFKELRFVHRTLVSLLGLNSSFETPPVNHATRRRAGLFPGQRLEPRGSKNFTMASYETEHLVLIPTERSFSKQHALSSPLCQPEASVPVFSARVLFPTQRKCHCLPDEGELWPNPKAPEKNLCCFK